METKNKLILGISAFVFCYAYFGQVITLVTVVIGTMVYMKSLLRYHMNRGDIDEDVLPSSKSSLKTPAKARMSNKAGVTPPTIRRVNHDIARTLKSVGKRFDPTKSSVTTDSMIKFLEDPRRSNEMSLEEFPGIGPKLARALQRDGVENAKELVRKFKRFSEEGGNTGYTCNRFYDYLHSLRDKYPKTMKGHANYHSATFGVASYADEKCTWFDYKLDTINE
jgi:hypothetical protein